MSLLQCNMYSLVISLSLSLGHGSNPPQKKTRFDKRNKRSKRWEGWGYKMIQNGRFILEIPAPSTIIPHIFFDSSIERIIISAANQGVFVSEHSSLQKRVSPNIIGILSASKLANNKAAEKDLFKIAKNLSYGTS